MMRGVFTMAAIVSLWSMTQLRAAPITYTLASTGNGALGASPFTDALVTVTLTGDTSAITSVTSGSDTVLANSGNATVNIAGVGTATFTGAIEIISTLDDTSLFGTSAVVIGQLANPSDPTSLTGILAQFDPVFFGYDLQGFAPVSGTGGVASGSHMTPHFQTTAGDLTWAIGQSLGTSTFSAVTGVPEPGTLMLLAPVLVALAAQRRFKQRP
jgi:hypothetical protein